MKKILLVLLMFFAFSINILADTENTCSYSLYIKNKRIDIDIVKNIDKNTAKLNYTFNGNTKTKDVGDVNDLQNRVYFLMSLGSTGTYNVYIEPELFKSDSCMQAYSYITDYGYYLTPSRDDAESNNEEGEVKDSGNGEKQDNKDKERGCSYTVNVDGDTLYINMVRISNDEGVEYVFKYGPTKETDKRINNIGAGKDIVFFYNGKRVILNKDEVKKFYEADSCLQAYSYKGSYNSLDGVLYGVIITTDMEEAENEKIGGEVERVNTEEYELTELNIGDEELPCSLLLGPVLSKIVKSTIRIFQIVAAIMAIVKGMLLVVPAVTSKDAEALNKVSGTLVKLAIVLVIIFILGPTVRLFGSLLGYDVSCLI